MGSSFFMICNSALRMLPSLAPPVASTTAMVKVSVASGILNQTDIYMRKGGERVDSGVTNRTWSGTEKSVRFLRCSPS